MKLSELIKLHNYKYLCGNKESQAEIKNGYTSDLLSDVIANIKDDSILITIQAHKNTIAVASLRNAPAILFCNNRPVAPDVIEAAEQEEIVLLSTSENQFVSSLRIGLALDLDLNIGS